MSKKVFMIFNVLEDKQKQAFWFVNTFIKEEYRDPGYLLSYSPSKFQNEYGISCNSLTDSWVWISERNISSYTADMTQVFYPAKNMGEL